MVLIQLILNLIVILSNLFTFRKHKVIAIETNTFSNHKNINKDLFKFYFFSFLTQLLYPFANSVIVPSMGIVKEIKKYFFLNHKIAYINNPINIRQIQKLGNDLNIPKILNNNKKNIVALGRLTWEKDYQNLIYSIKYLLKKTDVCLFIIGDGYLKIKLEKLIKELNLQSNVYLLGHIDNPYVYLKNCDLFVLTSISEGFPTSLLEALVLQPNIISTDCKYGPSEILENGKWGKLIPPANPKILCNEIFNLLNNPVKEVSTNRFIKFNKDIIMPKYIKIINKLK